MLRVLITIFAVLIYSSAIILIMQGEFTVGESVSLFIITLALLWLWMPLRWLYRLPFIWSLDRYFWRYGWFRRLLRMTVGQKEYNETESLLQDEKSHK